MSSTHGNNTNIKGTGKKQGWNMSSSVMRRNAWADYYTDDVGVYMGMDAASAGGIEICSSMSKILTTEFLALVQRKAAFTTILI